MRPARKIKWEFLQPFPVFRKIFLHAIMDKSTERRLKSIGNTMTVRTNPQENGEQLKKFPLNPKFLCATLPRPRAFASLCSLLDLESLLRQYDK